MAEYLASAVIDAAPGHVWTILTTAAGSQEWNPDIVAIAGTMAPGARIVARVKLGSGALRSVPMRVTAFEAPSRMEWIGGLPFGLFVGRRTFTVAPNGSGTAAPRARSPATFRTGSSRCSNCRVRTRRRRIP